jgi:hypothetical protein
MELQQGATLINIAMAQHVSAEDRGKRGFGEWKRVDRSNADRFVALGGCAPAG